MLAPRTLALRARVRAAMSSSHRSSSTRPLQPGAAAATAAGGGDDDDDAAALLASGDLGRHRRRLAAFTTLAAPHTHVYEVKKSRFVTTAWPVSGMDEASRLIAAARDESASHNCWAFHSSRDAASRCTDDGEPAGTAGRPILAAIEAEGVESVAVLVTRYRGGPKLGAGGLTRAYAAAARECLRSAARVEVQPRVGLTIEVPVADVGAVHAAVAAAGGSVEGETYAPTGSGVSLRASAPAVAVAGLVEALAGRTAGRASVAVVDEE